MTQAGPKGWDVIADEYDLAICEGEDSLRHDVLLPAVLDALGDVGGLSVLDAGCGPGILLPLLAKQGPRHLLGIDSSERMLAHASRRIGPYVKLEHACLETQTLERSAFDVVACVMVLHVLQDISAAVRNLSASLALGGRLVVAIPHPCFHFEQAYVTRWADVDGGATTPIPPPVDSYFAEHAIENALGASRLVAKIVHRPIQAYVQMLLQAGLTLTGCWEPRATVISRTGHLWSRVPAFFILRGERHP